MGRILLPSSAEIFRQRRLDAARAAPVAQTAFGPGELATTLALASTVADVATIVGSKLSDGGDAPPDKAAMATRAKAADLALQGEKKSFDAAGAGLASAGADFQALKVAPDPMTGLNQEEMTRFLALGDRLKAAQSTEEVVALRGELDALGAKMDAAPDIQIAGGKPARPDLSGVDFGGQPGSLSDQEDPMVQLARMRVQRRRGPVEQAPEEAAPVIPANPPVTKMPATRSTVGEQMRGSPSDGQGNSIPVPEVIPRLPYDQVRQMAIEAAASGDRDEILKVARLYRASNYRGVTPTGWKEALTGAHKKRADKEIADILKGAKKEDSPLDVAIKLQRLQEGKTKNQFLGGYLESRNQKASQDAIIAAARAGNAEAQEAAKTLGLQYTADIKQADAEVRPEMNEARLTQEQVKAKYADDKARLDKEFQEGRITGQQHINELNRIKAMYADELVRSQINRNNRPADTIVKVDARQQEDIRKGGFQYFKDKVETADANLEKAYKEMEEADAILEYISKDPSRLDPGYVDLVTRLGGDAAKAIIKSNADLRAVAQRRKAELQKTIPRLTTKLGEAKKDLSGSLRKDGFRYVQDDTAEDAGIAYPPESTPWGTGVVEGNEEIVSQPQMDGSIMSFSRTRNPKTGKTSGFVRVR